MQRAGGVGPGDGVLVQAAAGGEGLQPAGWRPRRPPVGRRTEGGADKRGLVRKYDVRCVVSSRDAGFAAVAAVGGSW